MEAKIEFPPFLSINHKVFGRQQMQPFHDHVLYISHQSQQQVKVRYSNFYDCYEIEGAARKGHMHPYKVWVEDLSKNIYMEETKIDVFFTAEQNMVIEGAVDAVLQEVWNRK